MHSASQPPQDPIQAHRPHRFAPTSLSTLLLSLRAGGLGLLKTLLARQALARSRARLKRLEPHALRDIGLTEQAAAKEARRAVWDAPEHWTRA